MEQEKKEEKPLTAEQQLEIILKSIQEQDQLRETNILNAVKKIKEDTGIFAARRFYLEMCLKFTMDKENGVEDDDVSAMLQIFEILNVA